MEERDFFDEKPEQRTHTMTCPHCGQPGEYQIGWLVRRKKAQLPRGADERDRARFAKAQSYMVRTDDLVGCKNIRCRKRFDVAGDPVRRFPIDFRSTFASSRPGLRSNSRKSEASGGKPWPTP